MLFVCRPGDHIITEWAYQILKLRSNALFLKFFLEGGYSPKGGVTSLSWTQETGVQTAHYNEQRNVWRVIKVSWSGNNNLPTDLGLHYQTMSSMSISLTFRDIRPALTQPQHDPQLMPEEN